MVCLEDDVICVPKGSITGITRCVPRCGDSVICESGADAKNCPTELTGGIVALIVIICLVVLIAVPIIIIFVRKRLGLSGIPKPVQSVIRFMRCCVTEDKDQSSIELANSSMTSQSLNGISNPALNTSDDGLKISSYTHAPSTRSNSKKHEYTVDYTVHQTSPTTHTQPDKTPGNYTSSQQYNANQHERPPQSGYDSHDARDPSRNIPFMITSQDGQKDYEIRSHITHGASPQHQPDTESHNRYYGGEQGYKVGREGYRVGEQGYNVGEQGHRVGETGNAYYRPPPRQTGYQPTTQQPYSGRSGYQPQTYNLNQNNSTLMNKLPPDQLHNALQRITRNEDLSPLNSNKQYSTAHSKYYDTGI